MLNPLNEPYDEGNRPSRMHSDIWRDGRDAARDWAQTPALPRDVPVWDDFEPEPIGPEPDAQAGGGFLRRLWCLGYFGQEQREACLAGGDAMTAGDNAPYVSASGAGVQSWFVRGGFIAVGLVMLTIGLAVIATGADPMRGVRSNVKAGLEGR